MASFCFFYCWWRSNLLGEALCISLTLCKIGSPWNTAIPIENSDAPLVNPHSRRRFVWCYHMLLMSLLYQVRDGCNCSWPWKTHNHSKFIQIPSADGPVRSIPFETSCTKNDVLPKLVPSLWPSKWMPQKDLMWRLSLARWFWCAKFGSSWNHNMSESTRIRLWLTCATVMSCFWGPERIRASSQGLKRVGEEDYCMHRYG